MIAEREMFGYAKPDEYERYMTLNEFSQGWRAVVREGDMALILRWSYIVLYLLERDNSCKKCRYVDDPRIRTEREKIVDIANALTTYSKDDYDLHESWGHIGKEVRQEIYLMYGMKMEDGTVFQGLIQYLDRVPCIWMYALAIRGIRAVTGLLRKKAEKDSYYEEYYADRLEQAASWIEVNVKTDYEFRMEIEFQAGWDVAECMDEYEYWYQGPATNYEYILELMTGRQEDGMKARTRKQFEGCPPKKLFDTVPPKCEACGHYVQSYDRNVQCDINSRSEWSPLRLVGTFDRLCGRCADMLKKEFEAVCREHRGELDMIRDMEVE